MATACPSAAKPSAVSQDLVVSNCVFNGTTSGIRIKSARDRGGLVANLAYQNLTMTNVERPVSFTAYYPRVPDADSPQPLAATTPVYRNIRIENLAAWGTKAAGEIVGLPECAISNLCFSNVQITAPKGITVRNARDIQFINSAVRAQAGPSLDLQTNATVVGRLPD